MAVRMTQHYRIDALLGRGGMGEVYRAFDTRLGRPVALKFLTALPGNEAAVRKFLREARAASALNHPNIITVHDVGESEAGQFIVMELVEGRTLRELIKERIPLEAVVPLLVQMVRALAAAHRAGIVHHDIKPENIMVRHDGYLKLLDFGLARPSLLGDDEQGSRTVTYDASGKLIGTLRYMSPEQIRSGAATTASDVFSLGVVFYEMISGRHPFDADTMIAVLNAITSEAPIPLTRLNPETPHPLEELVSAMLQKESALRPAAEEVDARLAALDQHKGSTTPRAPVMPKGVSVGRVWERAQLQEAFEGVTRGPGLMVCVAGESGLGKTTLVEEFLQQLGATTPWRADIGRGRCSERLEGTGAYLPFLEALENLMQGPGGTAVARLMKLLAPTWYTQIRTLSENSAASAPEKASSLERLKRELIAFLQEVSRTRAVILFFDDLHWADASTVDLINYLAVRFDVIHALILGTYRPDDLRLSKHPFLQVKLDLQSRGACRELELPFLGKVDTEKFLEAEFPGNQFPRTFSETIHSKTEGNPLFLVNVVRYLRDRNIIQQSSGRWILAQALPAIERDLPQSVRSMITRKIDQLSETNRRLLSVGAVQGSSFDTVVLSDALQADPQQVEESLQEMDQLHGLVRLAGESDLPDGTFTIKYRFVHVLYQHTVLAALTPTRRVALSAAVAKSLLEHYGAENAIIAGELALLFEAGREFARAAEYFLVAAQNATRLFANREAAALANRGIAMLARLPQSETVARQELTLRVTVGVALMSLKGYADPEVEDAYKRAETLCELLGESIALFPILWGLFTFHHVRAEMDLAMARSDQLLRLAHESNGSDALIQAHNARGITLLVMGKAESALDDFKQVMALYDPTRHASNVLLVGHDPGVLCKCYAGRAFWYLGYPDQALQSAMEGLAIARTRRHPYSIVFATAFVSFVEDLRRDFNNALKYSADAMRLADEDGFPVLSGLCGIVHGWARVHLDRSADGLSEIYSALEILKATGTEVTRSHNMMLLADALCYLQRFDECIKVVDDTLAWTERAGVKDYDPELYRIKAAAVSGSGMGAAAERESAAELLNRSLTVSENFGNRSWQLRSAMDLAELWNSDERGQAARSLVDSLYRTFTEGWDTYDLSRARTLLETSSQAK